ncbi:MAG: DNA mismatch endonuclease, patch repair protein [Parcubacteria group bacterium Gr01-1014_8]|nr:MAG: DNA mismatch endonuclease, patch repair protein [Parcubacteria group bacterium Gr01-1014_8]
MSAIRAKNTKPELLVRKVFRKVGIRGYRLHWNKVAGRPDIVFPKKKVAVFVHGCYWHGCPHCKLTLPKTHRAFWRAKFKRNKERDAHKTKDLRKLGWRVLTVWEHQIKKDADQIAARVVKALRDA